MTFTKISLRLALSAVVAGLLFTGCQEGGSRTSEAEPVGTPPPQPLPAEKQTAAPARTQSADAASVYDNTSYTPAGNASSSYAWTNQGRAANRGSTVNPLEERGTAQGSSTMQDSAAASGPRPGSMSTSKSMGSTAPSASASASASGSKPNFSFSSGSTASAPAAAGTAVVSQIARLNDYQPREEITGRLRSIGSDTMDVLMENWEIGFTQYHPNLRVLHEGRGSSTAPAALVEERADFGPMSRQIRSSEIDAFRNQFGYEPTQFPVAIDALAVYIHPDNPILQRGLTLEQLDAIFSSSRRRGANESIETWGDAGLTGEYANQPIKVYSRNSASGTYGVFRELVLLGGDYKGSNIELPDSPAVVQAVANDPYGIGYSGFGYKTPNVAILPIREDLSGKIVEASEENASSGDYPLTRYLYLTINYEPGTAARPLHREFMRYVYSQEGQEQVRSDGFFPVSPQTAADNLQKIGL